MPITAAVLTLPATPEAQRMVRTRLCAMPGVELGKQYDLRLPVVCESEDLGSHEEALRTIETTEGVCLMEIAFADFSDVGQGTFSGPRRARAPQKESHHGSS